MKHTLLSLTLAGAMLAPVSALARPVSDFEATLNLASRVEDQTVVQDIERVHPYEAGGVSYDKTATDIKRTKNLTQLQAYCALVRRSGNVSSERCLYDGPWMPSQN